MGGLNLKLMQGIEETEGLIKQGKQPQRAPASEAKQEKKSEEPSAGAQKVPATARNPRTSSRKEEGKKGREEKQVFSFRAPLGEIAAWKAFATATGETMEHIGCMAMDEYMKRHKLTATELAVFEALKERGRKTAGCQGTGVKQMVHAEMVFHTIKKINMQNNVMDTGVFAFVSSEHYSVDYSEDNSMAVATLTESVECKGEPSRFCLELTLEGVFLLDGVKSKAQKEEAHRKCYDSLFPVAAQLVQSLTAGCGAAGGIKIQKRALKQVNFGAEPEERNGKIIDFPLDR